MASGTLKSTTVGNGINTVSRREKSVGTRYIHIV